MGLHPTGAGCVEGPWQGRKSTCFQLQPPHRQQCEPCGEPGPKGAGCAALLSSVGQPRVWALLSSLQTEPHHACCNAGSSDHLPPLCTEVSPVFGGPFTRVLCDSPIPRELTRSDEGCPGRGIQLQPQLHRPFLGHRICNKNTVCLIVELSCTFQSICFSVCCLGASFLSSSHQSSTPKQPVNFLAFPKIPCLCVSWGPHSVAVDTPIAEMIRAPYMRRNASFTLAPI